MHILASSYFHLCWGEIKICSTCIGCRQTVWQHRATRGELCAEFCPVSLVLGELQAKMGQKEQNEHGDCELDVLDGSNTEKFKLHPSKCSYSLCT